MKKLVLSILSLLAVSLHGADTPATAKVGSKVTINVAADGTTPFNYLWRKNGTAIVGQTKAGLIFDPAAVTDTGLYTVVVSNSAGSVQSLNGVALTVTSAPVFTLQPMNQNVAAGTNVTFASLASGSPAPAYQWFKDGEAIVGAVSANLVLNATTTAASGAYTVTATNSTGTVTSSVAALTVNAPVIVAPGNPKFSVVVVPPSP